MDDSLPDDGSYYVFYRIEYSVMDELKEGWAILKLQQAFLGTVGQEEYNWFWKL